MKYCYHHILFQYNLYQLIFHLCVGYYRITLPYRCGTKLHTASSARQNVEINLTFFFIKQMVDNI